MEVRPGDRALTKSQLVSELQRLREQIRVLEGTPGQSARPAGAAVLDRSVTAPFDDAATMQRIAMILPSMVSITDLIDRCNVFSNERLTSILGHTPAQLQAMGRDIAARLLHPDDLAKLPDILRGYAQLADGEVVEHEYRIRHADGRYRWVHSNQMVLRRLPDGRPWQLLGVLHDITDFKEAEDAAQRSRRRLERQNTMLLELACSTALARGDRSTALHILTEAASRTLDVAHVSIWLFDEARRSLVCWDAYDAAANRHVHGLALDAGAFPGFLAALAAERVLAIDDAAHDPRVQELYATIVEPRGITSMLEAGIRRGDQLIGVLCCDHPGPQRTWMVEEETFAGSVADLTVRALEGIEHRRLELFQAATLRIAEAASKDRDLEALSRLVCATLAEATAARAVHIVVRDPETEALSEILATPTAHLDGAHARGVAKAIDRVYRGGQLLRCDGAELASLAGMEAEAVTGNWIGVPLLSDAGTLGVLMLEWDHGPEDSSPVLQRFLSEAALHLAHAIERTQREQALRARTRQQAAVAELGLQALGVADIPALLDTVVRLAARTLDVEFSKVLELQPGSETLLLRAGVGWQSGLVGRATVGSGRESQAGYTLLHGGPVIVRDLRTETRFNGPRLLIDHGIVSGISTVIQTRLERRFVLGVHTARKRVFSWDDAMFVQAIANVVAAAMLRLQAQSALQASEERLQRALERVEHARALQEDHDFTLLVVNGLPQSISVIDAEGRYEFVNPAGLRLLGFEERDVLGHKASEFVHPEDQAAIQRAMDDRRAGHTTTYEVRFVDKNGAIKAALVTGAPRFRGGHFAGTVAVAVDLGPLKMAQEQVLALEIEARRREREARLQVVQAQEEERVLLSREIHDGLGQLMVGLHLGLVARSHERQDLVEEISIARSAVSAAGRLSRRLHPPELDNSSVFSVVVEQLCTPQNAAGPRVHARSHGQEPALDRSRRGLLYRIACLAVERSVHVAHATHVDLVFEWSAQQLTLRVEDDGVPAPEDDAGIALRGIHDRAALLDGDVQATHAGDRNRLLITLRLAAH